MSLTSLQRGRRPLPSQYGQFGRLGGIYPCSPGTRPQGSPYCRLPPHRCLRAGVDEVRPREDQLSWARAMLVQINPYGSTL